MANSAYAKLLTISQVQQNQPWTVPYSAGVREAAGESNLNDLNSTPPAVPHILGSHTVLHAAKSLGKIAAVYEARDHDDFASNSAERAFEADRKAEIRKMAADLLTAALRFANLEGFDLAEALVERVVEKNGTDFGPIVVGGQNCCAENL
jgi:hypothetical protein